MNTKIKKLTSKPSTRAGLNCAEATGSRPSFVVVYGPPGSGKTINKEALRKHYRCTAILDDAFHITRWMLRGLTGRILVTSPGTGLRDPYDRRRVMECKYVHVDTAAKALGEKWVTPASFANTKLRNAHTEKL